MTDLTRILALQTAMDPASDRGVVVVVQYETPSGPAITTLSQQQAEKLDLVSACRDGRLVRLPRG